MDALHALETEARDYAAGLTARLGRYTGESHAVALEIARTAKLARAEAANHG